MTIRAPVKGKTMISDERTERDSWPVEGDQIGQLLRLVGPREAIPEERERRVKTAVHAVWLEDVYRRRARRRQVYWTTGMAALAAALTLVLGLAYWDYSASIAPGPDVVVATVEMSTGMPTFAVGRAIAARTGLETGADGRLALRLEGGPSLRLDTETRVSLDSASSVTLEEGTVYVDTGAPATGVGTPIEVRTAFGTARDVGTQFEVRVGEESMRLRVREGEVLLDRTGTTHSAAAGEELTVDARGDVSREPVALHGESWDWVLETSSLSKLRGASLEEILEWTSRETGWEVGYRDEAADRRVFAQQSQGDWPTGLRADEMIFVVLPTFGLEARLEGGTLWVGPMS